MRVYIAPRSSDDVANNLAVSVQRVEIEPEFIPKASRGLQRALDFAGAAMAVKPAKYGDTPGMDPDELSMIRRFTACSAAYEEEGYLTRLEDYMDILGSLGVAAQRNTLYVAANSDRARIAHDGIVFGFGQIALASGDYSTTMQTYMRDVYYLEDTT